MTSPIDISGKWAVRETWTDYDAGTSKNIKYEVTVIQEAQNIKMIMQELGELPTTISGSLEGNTFTMRGSYSYPEIDARYDGITTVNKLEVTFSDEGKTAFSDDTWVWQNLSDPEDVTTGIGEEEWIKTGDLK